MKKILLHLLLGIVAYTSSAQNIEFKFAFQDNEYCYLSLVNKDSIPHYILTTYVAAYSMDSIFNQDSMQDNERIYGQALTDFKYLHQYDAMQKKYYLNLEPFTNYLHLLLTDVIYLFDDRIIEPGQTKYQFAELLPYQKMYIRIASSSFQNKEYTDNLLTIEIERLLEKEKEIPFIYFEELPKKITIRLAYYDSTDAITFNTKKSKRAVANYRMKFKRAVTNYQIVETTINVDNLL